MTGRRVSYRSRRNRGAAAIIAMMFLVIFSSLGAAMAIVAQGNLKTADTHLKSQRALAAAETGMRFVVYRLNKVTNDIKTRDGVIDDTNAPDLWEEACAALATAISENPHNITEPTVVGDVLQIGPIAVGPDAPAFLATFTPHPLTDEDYDSDYYLRPPFDELDPPVSASVPLDSTWIRVRVVATDGPVSRSIQVDFRIDKKIRFALLAKSRVMIGRNVMIEGPIGSRFLETNLTNGHPIQMVSDFSGLASELDVELNNLASIMHDNDVDHDNRLNIESVAETEGIDSPGDYDLNGDGYIDDYDLFLSQYDDNGDLVVTSGELDTSENIHTDQLLELIDTFGDPYRPGYNDGVIDEDDRYAKIHGEISLLADYTGWNDGAAGGNIQDYYRGIVDPRRNGNALTFEADNTSVYEYTPSDFDVGSFRSAATGVFVDQAADQAAEHDPEDPDSPQPLGSTAFESVPFEAAHPYDWYERPVYENMTFTDVKIPKGTNALFVNCTFVGVTFIETSADNGDTNYNYAGMMEADGSLKYPDRVANVDGADVADTRDVSNNVRFHGCTFEGGIVSDVPDEYTHVRNKISFTGPTQFEIDGSANLSASEKQLYKRSTILTPHYSVELGTFVDPYGSDETVELSGTIVAGLIDIRGQVNVDGTILTTFEPVSGQSPVVGETSPQFNTTLGYFSSSDGDLETEMPNAGVGVIHLRYNENMPLPDGILGPIEIRPVMATYFEGGAS